MCPHGKISMMSAATAETYDLFDTPCHLVRLALKRAYDIFLEEVGSAGLGQYFCGSPDWRGFIPGHATDHAVNLC